MYSVHLIYLTDKSRNLSEPADEWSPWRPSISPASGSKMRQEWLGCLRGSLVAEIRAKTAACSVWLANGEQAYVQLCCPECSFCSSPSPPSAECPASPIPPKPCPGILFGSLLLSLPLPFLQRNCAWSFFPLSFFHSGCVFLVSVLNCGWHIRALAKLSPPGFYGWICSQWSFSVFRMSLHSALFPLSTVILSFRQETFVPLLVAFCSARVI